VILEGVVQRLIRRVGKTDQAFHLGDGLAVQASLNSFAWSLQRSNSAIKRPPSAWLRRSLTCSRCDVSSADLIIRNSFGGGGFSEPFHPDCGEAWPETVSISSTTSPSGRVASMMTASNLRYAAS
jgi:hypothetical protein